MWLSSPSVSFAPGEEARGDGADRLVHRLIVVGRRDDQVAIGDEVVLVDAVVVEQRAARRLDHADAFAAPRPLVGHQVRADDVGIVEQLARHFGRVQHLDHPRPVIHQRAVQRLAAVRRARNFRRSASASGVGMTSQTCTRASGPTRYQPFSAPSVLMCGNFM